MSAFHRCCRKIRFFAYRYGLSIEMHRQLEACCGAHHLGRLFAAQGHDVRLMSPEYVRPLCQGACPRAAEL